MRTFHLRDARSLSLLHSVSHDGLRATFSPDLNLALAFTEEERDDFKETNPHIKGRWVLKKAEQARRKNVYSTLIL